VSARLQLDALPADLLADARLIGFETGIVVPSQILRRLGYGAYNFHPGPPEYPGWEPFSFAIYDQASTFGATAHEMIRKVDAGPIIGVMRFPMPPNIMRDQLHYQTLKAMLKLFRRLAPSLVTDPKPLPAMPITWGKPTRTRADFNRMCELPADLDEEERKRRRRAFIDVSRVDRP
jgi:methionyl-tRNA formyltransferase